VSEEFQELFVKQEPYEVVIEHEGKNYTFKVKEVSWSKRNQILGQCTKVDRAGNPTFDLDRYLREMLVNMIVEAPWGKTDHLKLAQLSPEFGAKLEKLVPTAYKEEGIVDFFEKEQESS
jgi:hypothetical protein